MKIALLSILLFFVNEARALETDQFTRPPKPVTDIAAPVAKHVEEAIASVLEKQPKTALSERDLAKSLYDLVAKGLIKTQIENFIDSKAFPKSARYSPGYPKSIFAGVMAPIPFGHVVQAPTIRMFGSEFGADKIGHFFQQGFEYYELYLANETAGHDEAAKAAVQNGVRQEHGIYGINVSGVFSNADLASNYAGLVFFLNLTREMKVGSAVLPPILVRDGERWLFAPDFKPVEWLKPFISDHFNEALNPSEFYLIHGLVAKNTVKRCESWSKAEGAAFTLDRVKETIKNLSTWFGEPYGHRLLPEHEISLATACFSGR